MNKNGKKRFQLPSQPQQSSLCVFLYSEEAYKSCGQKVKIGDEKHHPE
jgi:hypothetical protein